MELIKDIQKALRGQKIPYDIFIDVEKASDTASHAYRIDQFVSINGLNSDCRYTIYGVPLVFSNIYR